MEDTMKMKDEMMKKAMAESKMGMTRCETHRGKMKSQGRVDTEYGSKPMPHE